MAGQATAGRSISATLTDIHSVREEGNPSGIGGTDTSAIGGEGRKGASGHGMLDDPTYTRIDMQVVNKPMNGTATGGETGPNSGYGRTFGK